MIFKDNPLRAEYLRGNCIDLFEYWDVDSFDDLELEKIRQVYVDAFIKTKYTSY